MTTQMWREASWAERDQLPGNPTSAHGADRIHHDFLLQHHAVATVKNPARHWDSLLALVGHTRSLGPVDIRRLRHRLLRRLAADDRRLGTGQLPVLCPTQLQATCTYYRRRRGRTIAPPWNLRVTCSSTRSCNGSPVTSVFTISITSTFASLSIACPRSMDAIPELQSPVTTTLSPRDIRDCFRVLPLGRRSPKSRYIPRGITTGCRLTANLLAHRTGSFVPATVRSSGSLSKYFVTNPSDPEML